MRPLAAGASVTLRTGSGPQRPLYLRGDLALVAEEAVLDHIRDGRLVRVLEDWTPPFPGYHLYYTSRRQASPAFQLVVDTLRYRR